MKLTLVDTHAEKPSILCTRHRPHCRTRGHQAWDQMAKNDSISSLGTQEKHEVRDEVLPLKPRQATAKSVVVLHLTVTPVAADPTAPRRCGGRISASRGAPAGDQSERKSAEGAALLPRLPSPSPSSSLLEFPAESPEKWTLRIGRLPFVTPWF